MANACADELQRLNSMKLTINDEDVKRASVFANELYEIIDDLNEFEQGFVDDIHKRLADGLHLTPTQFETLLKIHQDNEEFI